ncbi:hypothetical protein Y032_0117g634 [Ancylostoma ceylanicum]|uniref:Uncharacterized protein n=1 Tax=Ancylostoma ceylanicum TaxID=53326 RepID=A0A016TBX3_9BILA|nr:hypothetical protein Y032_0117g634 [Ancylostoma ceylanicum]
MIIVEGMCSESSVEGSWPSSSSSSNLSRLRSGLGHSDPQISASSSHTPSPKGSHIGVRSCLITNDTYRSTSESDGIGLRRTMSTLYVPIAIRNSLPALFE